VIFFVGAFLFFPIGQLVFWLRAAHFVPSCYSEHLRSVIAYLALTMPAIILYESFLSFLGLGVQVPTASWGTLISDGVANINPVRIYWWLIAFPTACS
jgi:oligopeptide transport system permease protein